METARWVEALPTEPRRWAAISLVEDWAEADPLGALLWAESRLADAGVAHAAWNAARAQGPKLAAYLSIRPRGPSTSDRVRFVAEFWAWRELSAALAWMHALPESVDRRAAFSGLLRIWTRRDAPAALAEAVRADDRLEESVLSDWAGTDFAAAASWLLANPAADEERANRRLSAVVRGTLEAHDDPASAVYLFERQIPTAPEGRFAFGKVMERWAELDGAAAEAWAVRQSRPRLAWPAAATLAAQYVKNAQPRVAADWLTRFVAAGPKFDPAGSYEVSTVFSTVGSALAMVEPARAAAWATGLATGGPGVPAEQAVGATVLHWVSRDPRAALAWVQSLPVQLQSSARGQLFEQLARADGPAAAELTLALPAALRGREQTAVARNWQQLDPAAAAAWWETVQPGVPLPPPPFDIK